MRRHLRFSRFDRPHAGVLLALILLAVVVHQGPAEAQGMNWFDCFGKVVDRIG